jgi:spore maturation protein SpmA
MLNSIWGGLLLLALGLGFLRGVVSGSEVVNSMADALFASAKTGFELTIGLAATLILWLGLLQIAEAAGAVRWLARVLTPVLHRLMPDVPRGHPVFGSAGLNVGMSM